MYVLWLTPHLEVDQDVIDFCEIAEYIKNNKSDEFYHQKLKAKQRLLKFYYEKLKEHGQNDRIQKAIDVYESCLMQLGL